MTTPAPALDDVSVTSLCIAVSGWIRDGGYVSAHYNVWDDRSNIGVYLRHVARWALGKLNSGQLDADAHALSLNHEVLVGLAVLASRIGGLVAYGVILCARHHPMGIAAEGRTACPQCPTTSPHERTEG